MTKSIFALALCCATVSAGAAFAGPLATVNATYDPFLDNTVFSIDNLSSSAIDVTLLTNFGPTTAVDVGSIAGGDTYQYTFNQLNGGFEIDPQGAGILDTTLYELEVTESGTTLLSGWFSPLSNLTGHYVDFLGNTCYGQSGCGVAQSGIVAEVPEPSGISLFGMGMVGVALLRRRRVA